MASVIPVAASGARTATGNSGFIPTPPGEFVAIQITTTAASGTPNFVFSVEWTQDGTNFGQTDTTADAFAAITATGVSKVARFANKGSGFRLFWTVTGGTPSITFSATAYGVGSQQAV